MISIIFHSKILKCVQVTIKFSNLIDIASWGEELHVGVETVAFAHLRRFAQNHVAHSPQF